MRKSCPLSICCKIFACAWYLGKIHYNLMYLCINTLNIGREVGQLSKVVDLEEIKVVLEFIVT
jgi:hypothetical protein